MSVLGRLLLVVLCSQLLLSNDSIVENNKVKCNISQLDNDDKTDIIICKYIQNRISVDNEIFVEWINPKGKVDRARKLKIPAGHGSVYDYRYLKGRSKGVWKFVASDNDQKYITKFEVK